MTNNLTAWLTACRVELARQRAIEQAATPGPWTTRTKAGVIHYVEPLKALYGACIVPEKEADARLMTLARNAFPRVLDVAEKMLRRAAESLAYNEYHGDGDDNDKIKREWLRPAAALLGVPEPKE